jgi:gas vesicle protein GvpN
MKYTPVHNRVVRGKRLHETTEERSAKALLKKTAAESAMERVESEFLVPTLESFIETDQIRNFKNRVKLWIKAGCPPHLVGPTGCGKTAMAMQVAKELGRPMVWINGDDQMTTTDLIGGYSEMEAESLRDKYIHNVFVTRDRTKYSWVDNPLTLACKNGYTLIYNEFSRAKPEANNVLLSILEEQILELPTMFGRERYIKVHPDFNVIFTSNSIEYAGVHKPQDALLDRMVDIYMDYFDFDTEVKIVQTQGHIPLQEAKRVVRAVRKIREKMPPARKPGTRAEVMISRGLKALESSTKDDVEQLYIDVLATKIGSPKENSNQCNLIKEVVRETYNATRIGAIKATIGEVHLVDSMLLT